jgi:hypothetical protein
MMSRFAGWWRNHRGAVLVYGVVAAASLIVGAASVIIWKYLKLNAQTWAAAIAAVAAVGATLVALKALSYNRQSTGAADRAARAAENQTKWTAPGILEALIPGRMQSHASTAEVP